MGHRRQFGSVRRLPSGRWQARFTSPDRRTVTAPKTFRTKADAEVWLADRRREIDRGLWNPGVAERTVFGPYAAAWLANREIRPKTRESYTRILTRHLVPAFGTVALAAITPASVRQWHAGLLPGKPSMRAQCYAMLRAIMNTALDDELISVNPCRVRGAGQTVRVRKIRPASVHELGLLAEAMPERLRLMVPLASWLALRYGETIELRRHDIDLADEVIRVRRAAVRIDGAPGGHVVGEPKTRAGIRDVTIPPHLLEPIAEHLAKHVGPERNSLLFPSVPGGSHHLSLSAHYRVWSAVRAAAGRPDLRWHDLRHSGAVLAAATGASLAELMARLGHSTPGAALRYQHVARGRDREIAALLSKLAED
jgi:integrase